MKNANISCHVRLGQELTAKGFPIFPTKMYSKDPRERVITYERMRVDMEKVNSLSRQTRAIKHKIKENGEKK